MGLRKLNILLSPSMSKNIIEEFEEIRETVKVFSHVPAVINDFVAYYKRTEREREEWKRERTTFTEKLDTVSRENANLEAKITKARVLLDSEKSKRIQVEEQKTQLVHQLELVESSGISHPTNSTLHFGSDGVDHSSIYASDNTDFLMEDLVDKTVDLLANEQGLISESSARNWGTIAKYAPSKPPMIPTFVVNCTREVEFRGINEVGIYYIPGQPKQMEKILEPFLSWGKAPKLCATTDIHSVAASLLLFLDFLQEPLIGWRLFVQYNQMDKAEARVQYIFEVLNTLPRSNRDTLAFLIIHLQRITKSSVSLMTFSRLAKVFTRCFVGTPFGENEIGDKIMEDIFSIPIEEWETLLNLP